MGGVPRNCELVLTVSDSADVFINDTSIHGALEKEGSAINYYPLHGCILHADNDYIFSKTEISKAFTDNSENWVNLKRSVSIRPILFWGWSFEDSDVIDALYCGKKNIDANDEKWIVLLNPKQVEIDFYEALSFNIIIASTMDMLIYLGNNQFDKENSKGEEETRLAEYCPPRSNASIPQFPLIGFYEGDSPKWSQILSGSIPLTHHFSEIYDRILDHKNIIVIGIPASGKTTLMMQLLYKLSSNCEVHMLTAPSCEQARLYLKRKGNSDAIIFIDNCFRDIDALLLLLEASHLQVIAFDRDYSYESRAFMLRERNFIFDVYDVTEINEFDARKIIDSIPAQIKNKKPSILITDSTIFSILSRNTNGPRFEKRFAAMIDDFYKNNQVATEVFVMICYVHACGVPVSLDMVISFLRDITDDYREVYKIIGQVGGIIKSCSDDSFNFLNINFQEQDYYQARTRYFAELILRNLPINSPVFGKVLLTFCRNVPRFKICSYDQFKRKAYDADFTVKAFSNYLDGQAFYEICSDIDESEYLYQQAALYFSRKHKYTIAFDWIDKARNFTSFNRFSIDNTYAIILFEANIHIEDNDGSVKQLLLESLDILQNCYKNDRRKLVHARTLAISLLQYIDVYGSSDVIQYIELAYDWLLTEAVSRDTGARQKVKLNGLIQRLKVYIY